MQILYSITTTLCLCIGFYFGFKIGRTNELPKMKTKQEKKQEKEQEKKMNKWEKSLRNLNGYSGSSKGQEEIE